MCGVGGCRSGTVGGTSYSGCPFFFFQAEDGIRDSSVTGVQTCALPILIPADDRNDRGRVLVAVLQEPEVEGRLDIAGGEGGAIMPLDAVAKLPGYFHLAATHLDVAVFEGRDLGDELGVPILAQLRFGRNVLVRLHR